LLRIAVAFLFSFVVLISHSNQERNNSRSTVRRSEFSGER